jgi:hypothetical protein
LAAAAVVRELENVGRDPSATGEKRVLRLGLDVSCQQDSDAAH